MKTNHLFLLLLFLALFTGRSNAQNPKLPSGPDGPGKFGAYYTHLKYTPEWDKNWRVADHPDVVVRFDDGGHKFVFWRGTSYIPCWVTDTDAWYTNEFVERRGHHSKNTQGCVEPMSDKQCRYSHVRVIESNDARVVIHWRYAPCDVHYEHPFSDEQTGWFDWVDEYYVIYPDATGIRAITVQSSGLHKWIEFQEAILINPPGTLPEDNIEPGAISIANMDGEHVTYVWDEDGGPEFDENPDKSNIFKVNLKGSRQPFALVAPPTTDGNLITPYLGHGQNSFFNWWDHWPVSQDASDGRGATSAANPSHSSLAHIGLPGHATAEWEPYSEGENIITKLMVHGMTDKPVEELVPLAKSWLNAPELKLQSDAFSCKGYDPGQMAYVLELKSEGTSTLEFTLEAGPDKPVHNPAFVIKNWGSGSFDMEVNGTKTPAGKGTRFGTVNDLDGDYLVVWHKMDSTDPVHFKLNIK